MLAAILAPLIAVLSLFPSASAGAGAGATSIPVISSAGPKLGQIPIRPDILCGVGVATGAEAWECYDYTDGQAITVFQTPAASTYALSPFGGRKELHVAAGVSYRPSANIDGDLFSGPFTAVVAGNASTSASVSPIWLYGATANAGFYMQQTSSPNHYCRGTAADGSNGSSTLTHDTTNRWSVVSCIYDGTSITARANGKTATSSPVQIAPLPPGERLYFTATSSGGSFNAGKFGAVAIYKRALTDAELTVIEAGWFGNLVDGRPITVNRPTPAVCEWSGGLYTVGDHAACVREGMGLFVGKAATNYVTDFDAALIQSGVTRTKNADGSWRFCYPSGATASFSTEVALPYTGVTEGSQIFGSFQSRAVSDVSRVYLILEGGAAASPLTPTSDWTTLQSTGTKGTGLNRFYLNATAAAGGCVDVRLPYFNIGISSQPRPVTCTTAPCTTGGEIPSFSTAGFPWPNGEVEFTVTPTLASDANRLVMDARLGDREGALYYVHRDGPMALLSAASTAPSSALSWPLGKTWTIAYGWSSSGSVKHYRNGALITEVTGYGTPDKAGRDQACLGAGCSGTSTNFDGYVWPTYVGEPRAKAPASYFEADLWHSGEPWACSSADGCVADCWVDSSGEKVCTGADFMPITVTQAEAGSVSSTPFRPANGTAIYGSSTPTNVMPATIAAGSPGWAEIEAALESRTSTVIAAYVSPDSGNKMPFSIGASSGGMQFQAGSCHWFQSSGVSAQVAGSASAWAQGSWTLGACVQDGDTIKARRNSVTTTASAAGVTTAIPFVPVNVGGYGTPTLNLDVPLAHVRIYNRALSDAELAEYEARMWGTWAAKPGVPVLVSRSTPAPCSVQDGTFGDPSRSWYTLGPNVGCVSDRGLEVRGLASNYEGYSNAITSAGGWSISGEGSITPLADGYRIDLGVGGVLRNSGYGTLAAAGQAWTSSVEVRGSASIRLTPLIAVSYGPSTPIPSASAWSRLSHTVTASGGETARTYLACGSGAEACSFDLRQVQREASAVPGAVVDCGGAPPCTRASDVATVSTSGWPIERGSIDLTYTPAVATTGVNRILFDGRGDGSTVTATAPRLYVTAGNALGFNAASTANSSALAWEAGTPTYITAAFTGVPYTVARDAVSVLSGSWSSSPGAWAPIVRLGSYHLSNSESAEGWIKSIRLGAN